jgi:hypothetical protein
MTTPEEERRNDIIRLLELALVLACELGDTDTIRCIQHALDEVCLQQIEPDDEASLAEPAIMRSSKRGVA